MFKRLCQVTGVGAKTALGVLSALPLRDLSVAIVTGDVAALSRAPGVGKKTAQRIVLELKDKVAKGFCGRHTRWKMWRALPPIRPRPRAAHRPLRR